MNRQHNIDTLAKRRGASTRNGILAVGCVAGALLLGTSAEARTNPAANQDASTICSSVLRGQLTGNSYHAAGAQLQPLDSTPVTGHHSDYSYHGDTPHNDTGVWIWHTDVGHGDYVNHTDVTSTSTTPPSP